MSAFAGHPFNAYFAAAVSADACAACSDSACGDHADHKAFSEMDAMLLMASIFVCIALLCRTLLVLAGVQCITLISLLVLAGIILNNLYGLPKTRKKPDC